MIKKSAKNWLSGTCKFAMSLNGGVYATDSSEDDSKPIQKYVQWMTSDNKFYAPATKVAKSLPPGYYNILQTIEGIFFQRQDEWKEKLIEFPETESHKVVDEIEKFWEKEQVYRDAKLAYRRGLMLMGSPGGGKSSIIKLAIRNVVKRNGIVFNFGSSRSFLAGIQIFREVQPTTPVIVIMEDIDAILSMNNESEVLNILDGVVPMDKTVFIASTNYPERLGSRIMNRPSRFDKRFEIGMPNAESRKIYLKEITSGKVPDKTIDKWVDDTEGLSIAHLKELVVSVNILDYKYQDAIDALKGLKTKVYSDEYKEANVPVFELKNTKVLN